jgi:hypothetical protein
MMYRIMMAFMLLLAAGCAAAAGYNQPLTYLSMERPKNTIVTEKKTELNIMKNRVGFMYRNPIDIGIYLSEAETTLGSKMMRNIDVKFAIPICYILICVGSDQIELHENVN